MAVVNRRNWDDKNLNSTIFDSEVISGTFSKADLIGTVYEIRHNKGFMVGPYVITDNSNQAIIPNDVTYEFELIRIDLGTLSSTMTGEWRYTIGSKGADAGAVVEPDILVKYGKGVALSKYLFTGRTVPTTNYDAVDLGCYNTLTRSRQEDSKSTIADLGIHKEGSLNVGKNNIIKSGDSFVIGDDNIISLYGGYNRVLGTTNELLGINNKIDGFLNLISPETSYDPNSALSHVPTGNTVNGDNNVIFNWTNKADLIQKTNLNLRSYGQYGEVGSGFKITSTTSATVGYKSSASQNIIKWTNDSRNYRIFIKFDTDSITANENLVATGSFFDIQTGNNIMSVKITDSLTDTTNMQVEVQLNNQTPVITNVSKASYPIKNTWFVAEFTYYSWNNGAVYFNFYKRSPYNLNYGSAFSSIISNTTIGTITKPSISNDVGLSISTTGKGIFNFTNTHISKISTTTYNSINEFVLTPNLNLGTDADRLNVTVTNDIKGWNNYTTNVLGLNTVDTVYNNYVIYPTYDWSTTYSCDRNKYVDYYKRVIVDNTVGKSWYNFTKYTNVTGVNNLVNSQNSNINGQFNAIGLSNNINLTGDNNNILGIHLNVNGDNNTVFGGYNTVTGIHNTISDYTLSGSDHVVASSISTVFSSHNFICGNYNTINRSNTSMIIGKNNGISSNSSHGCYNSPNLIVGRECSIQGGGSMILGNNSYITSDELLQGNSFIHGEWVSIQKSRRSAIIASGWIGWIKGGSSNAIIAADGYILDNNTTMDLHTLTKNAILGGLENKIIKASTESLRTNNNVILGGQTNTITSTENSVIIGGLGNNIPIVKAALDGTTTQNIPSRTIISGLMCTSRAAYSITSGVENYNDSGSSFISGQYNFQGIQLSPLYKDIPTTIDYRSSSAVTFGMRNVNGGSTAFVTGYGNDIGNIIRQTGGNYLNGVPQLKVPVNRAFGVGNAAFASGVLNKALTNVSFVHGINCVAGTEEIETDTLLTSYVLPLAVNQGGVNIGSNRLDTYNLSNQGWEINSSNDSTRTWTKGIAAIAFGINTQAKGSVSTTFGFGTIAENNYQLVLGKFNAASTNSIFTIGNGTSDSVRSNLLEVLTTGDIIAPNTTISVSSNVKSLVTKEYVDGLVGSLWNQYTLDTNLNVGSDEVVMEGRINATPGSTFTFVGNITAGYGSDRVTGTAGVGSLNTFNVTGNTNISIDVTTTTYVYIELRGLDTRTHFRIRCESSGANSITFYEYAGFMDGNIAKLQLSDGTALLQYKRGRALN